MHPLERYSLNLSGSKKLLEMFMAGSKGLDDLRDRVYQAAHALLGAIEHTGCTGRTETISYYDTDEWEKTVGEWHIECTSYHETAHGHKLSYSTDETKRQGGSLFSINTRLKEGRLAVNALSRDDLKAVDDALSALVWGFYTSYPKAMDHIREIAGLEPYRRGGSQ